MNTKFMRNHYGFFYKDNFQYWVSRLIPSAVINPLPFFLGYFLPIILDQKGEAFPVERIAPGIGLYLAVSFTVASLLYICFRFMDKKEYIKKHANC